MASATRYGQCDATSLQLFQCRQNIRIEFYSFVRIEGIEQPAECFCMQFTNTDSRFAFLVENKQFTEFGLTTSNILEISDVSLSVLFYIIEKSALFAKQR